jgi:Lantibiotic dehydratase, N terminus
MKLWVMEPLIVRIAGLPASRMAPFGSAACLQALQAAARAGLELAEVRAGLIARLHELAGAAPPASRRFLLAVKRDCYNGRSLLRHRGVPQWEELVHRTSSAADRLLVLEEQERDSWLEFDRLYDSELQRELCHLRAVLGCPAFRRGLALASAALAARLSGRETTAGAHDSRREKRAALSLLRYASRAAFKLSPFSTLTRLALARTAERPSPPETVRILGGSNEWTERSLVRLRRYLVQQLVAVLLQSPAFRDALPVQLNSSLREIAADHYRFLRPAGWEIAGEGRPARLRPLAFREIPLRRAIVDWLRERTSDEVDLPTLKTSIGELLGEDGEAERSARLVDRLLDLGLLLPLLPWPAHEPRLEEKLLELVRRCPAGGELLAAPLARILELEDGFAAAADPLAAASEIERQLDTAWSAVLAAAGLPASTRPPRSRENEVFEDVLLLGKAAEELVTVDAGRLAEVLASLQPWLRLVDFFSPRYDLLYTFAALARRTWPDCGEVGAVELFDAARPYRQEMRTLIAAAPEPEHGPGFNPLNCPEIAELKRLRREVWDGLRALLREDGEVSRIAGDGLQSLLDLIPPDLVPLVGPCAFLQPVDRQGDLWVLNRLFEGTGRYASRFTAVMPEAVRRRFTEPLTALSSLDGGGEPMDLLDLLSGLGDTLNVHALQTHRVMSLPGEPLGVEPDREVDANELRVRIDRTGLPRLVDGAGRRLLPVHLGGAALAYNPPWITFLALFGPGELRPIPVPRIVEPRGETKVLGRVVLGRVVLGRQRWVVPTADIAAEVAAAAPSRAFAAIDRWRRSWDLPERVFAIERVHFKAFKAKAEVYKPQYLDFTSPSFCELFAALLRTNGSSLTLEEVLPAAAAFPRDEAGESWAVELQAEAFASRPPSRHENDRPSPMQEMR